MRTILAIGLLVVSAGLLAPAVAQTASEDGVGADIQKLEKQWVAAATKQDIGPLQSLLAEDYTLTNPVGQVVPKAIFVAKIKDGSFKIESLEYGQIKVRTYGDAAVVTGRIALRGAWEGTDVSGEYAFTDTFIKQAGKWRQAAGQVTRVES